MTTEGANSCQIAATEVAKTADMLKALVSRFSMRVLARVLGVLAPVLSELRSHDLNVKQMENRVFEGSNAAVAIKPNSRIRVVLCIAGY